MNKSSVLTPYLSPLAAWGLAFGFLVAWSLLLAYMAILWANATALEKLRNLGPRPFDLLVTDLKMPGMSGKDLVDAVRADPVLAKLPVFVFTADDELENTYASMGFTGALIKPATAETVKAMLDSITAKPGA